ncbi:Na+/H+ antiporter [Alloalcanivorax mobilis]|uniref:Na+/H+ antiporter n=1 Tax=Alloalcanivorax mobilis TaxID=2019569 RepID=UPI000C775A23|nr:Na+/H+ antiporter [Alloalcanivorax mobilis]
MDAITVSLAMLIAVMVSGMISRALPVPLPLPLVQIALGAVIAGVFDRGVELEPEFFFFLFLPPLLFLDGWRIPKEGLLRDRVTILELALGLVIVTVVGLGFMIHWMIPTLPLPVAFALAAIVSPTDPVAVSAITQRVPVPKRIMHILEGESLLNDASGLVAFRFAVAAAVTGVFSVTSATLSFLWVALGGIALGAGLTWSITFAKGLFSQRFGEEPGSQILLSLLIPFGAYALAEHLGASGILAAVAAGITMSYAELSGRALASTRMQRSAVWNTVQFTLNGIIFVLLGEQLPDILDGAVRVVQEAGHLNPWWLVVYALAINVALAVLRFTWVWLSLRVSQWLARRRGEPVPETSLRMIGAISLAGVRGAITLAGVLTLPLVLNDGSPLPGRDLAIFLAAMVIIISLIAASVGLPRMLKGLELPPETEHHRQEDLANEAARQAAVKAVEASLHELTRRNPNDDPQLYTDVAGRVMEGLQQLATGGIAQDVDAERVQRQRHIERQMRLAALAASRDEFFKLARRRRISDELARELVRRVDLQEARLL